MGIPGLGVERDGSGPYRVLRRIPRILEDSVIRWVVETLRVRLDDALVLEERRKWSRTEVAVRQGATC